MTFDYPAGCPTNDSLALMIEFMETQSFLPSDFVDLDGKVLLLLSSDDDKFGAEIPDMLINLMPNPRVQIHIRRASGYTVEIRYVYR